MYSICSIYSLYTIISVCVMIVIGVIVMGMTGYVHECIHRFICIILQLEQHGGRQPLSLCRVF